MSGPLRPLAVLGTGSDVGKSILTAAFCRIFANRGEDVAPFKAQNMSNNAGVTPEGGEMGRAQILQAHAARVAPHVDMNPVLLKPSSDRRSQVVVLGEVLGDRDAGAYFRDTTALRALAYGALDRLRGAHARVVIEGAGSCAEVNLRPRDFVNFDVAHHCDAAVTLVADINKGGVFAQVVGSLACMPPADRARVTSVCINRFRGDPALFDDGMAWLHQQTGLPIFLVPWLRGLHLDDEDGLSPNARLDPPVVGQPRLRIAALRLPRFANFTDLLAVERIPGVELHWLGRLRALGDYDAVILPGTKNTRADLDWLVETGFFAALQGYVRDGGHVLGLCGGWQMLGEAVDDPEGLEGPLGSTPGLGLLPARTVLRAPKITTPAAGRLASGEAVEGYEIHMGRTESAAPPWVRLTSRRGAPVDAADGGIGHDGRVLGTYLHGVLDTPAALAAWARTLRPGDDFADVAALPGAAAQRDAELDRLAAHVAAHLDVDHLFG